MPAPQASEDFYSSLQRYQLALLTIGRRLWRKVVPGDLDGSWQRVMPRMVAYTAGAQLAAAQAAVQYVPAVLEETGQPDRPQAAVRPQAFSGVSYDGRPLDTALEGSVRHAKQLIGSGREPDEALIGGRKWLEQALQTAVADAARDATAAQIAVRETMGWVRMVNPPCCSRCAVLAGKWYRWSDGFLRHPGCDCVHIPTAENASDDYVTDPRLLVERGLITDLTKGQRQRLDEGTDLSKVLNESRDRWRQRMAVERRAARRARYSPAETRAADRREARRASNGLVVPTGWGGGSANLPPGGIQDFLNHLTSRVDAINEMKRRGIAE